MDAQGLGRYLRQSREARELTLDDAEQVLHIRQRVLESFELGDFSVPDASIVQIRGFIRNYAHYLELDEEKVVQYYEAARLEQENPRKRGKKRRQRDTQPIAPVAARSITDTDPALPVISTAALEEKRRQRGAGFLTLLFRVLVSGAALAVIVFVVIQLTRNPNQARDDLVVPAPDILGQLPGSPTFTPPPTATVSSLLPTLPPTNESGFTGQGVMVSLVTTQRTWLRVVADDVEQYAGIAPPGTRLEIDAQTNVTITASNAEGLDVVWNGQNQRSFGQRGQQVDVVFTETNVNVVAGSSLAPTSPFTLTPVPTSPVDADARIAESSPTVAPAAEEITPADAQAVVPTPLPAVTADSQPIPDGLTTPASNVPTPLPGVEPIAPAIPAVATEIPQPTQPPSSSAQDVPPPSPFRQALQLPTLTPDPNSTVVQPQSVPADVVSGAATPDPAVLGADVAAQSQNDPLSIPPSNSTLDPAIVSADQPQPPTATPEPLSIPQLTATPLPSPTDPGTPTALPTPSPLPTLEPTATETPTITLSPTETLSPTPAVSPTPTAILPLRRPQFEPSPTKNGA
jgi:cytoskeletal protein RodZ